MSTERCDGATLFDSTSYALPCAFSCHPSRSLILVAFLPTTASHFLPQGTFQNGG